MRPSIRSEQVSDYVGYILRPDGTVMDKRTAEPVPVYANGSVRLVKRDGKKECVQLHRLMAEAFVENPNGYKFVKFKDGDSTNRDADNLVWARSAKDVSDMTADILRLKADGWSTADIAYSWSVTPQYVNRVLKEARKRTKS